MDEQEKLRLVEFLNKKRVFLVGSVDDSTVLVAIHPTYKEQTRTLWWWDTIKERVKEVVSIELGEKPILRVSDTQGNFYFFIPLSLELYNNLIRDKMLIKKEFPTEEKMIEAFEDTIV